MAEPQALELLVDRGGNDRVPLLANLLDPPARPVASRTSTALDDLFGELEGDLWQSWGRDPEKRVANIAEVA